MFAKDIMTPNVITVGPDDSLESIANLLIENRISAVPVVNDEEELIGIVSEGDLVHRVRGDFKLPRSWWLSLIGDPGDSPKEYIRSHGSVASDVMIKKVIIVTEFTSIAEIAEILETMRIKRVPVVRAGKLVGIVSRANIIQALVSQENQELLNISTSDQEIRQKLVKECSNHYWSPKSTMNVIVMDGIVQYWGFVESEDAKDALRLAAKNIPGVKAVKENLIISAAYPDYV
jgi:CBS domain-containing protein|nr:CBS domain-containing protein [Rhodospirillales bacterium]